MELKFCSQAQSQWQAQAETRAQTWIVMQVAYINRRAFMQLLIKTTNVMTNFKNKTVFNFALPCRYPLPAYRSACLPPPFCFPSTFKLSSSVADCAYEIVCLFLFSHAHYRPKPNGTPRADCLYPVRVHTSAAYAAKHNTVAIQILLFNSNFSSYFQLQIWDVNNKLNK